MGLRRCVECGQVVAVGDRELRAGGARRCGQACASESALGAPNAPRQLYLCLQTGTNRGYDSKKA